VQDKGRRIKDEVYIAPLQPSTFFKKKGIKWILM